MEFLKALFPENGALTWEQFEAAAKEKNVKIADLSSGAYVSKKKYDDDITAKNSQITELNDTIGKRDTDLGEIRKQLETAGADKDKLAALSADLTALQTKYDTDTANFKTQIAQQAYEFAVRDFAGTKKFTSNAAKRDFINSMNAAGLKYDNGAILGADDFVKQYTADNADAFVAEAPPEEPAAPAEQFPAFAATTPGKTPAPDNGFNFNFTGVRKHE